MKYPTHRLGGLLDHFWTNSEEEDINVEQECQYYTDHDALFFIPNNVTNIRKKDKKLFGIKCVVFITS